MKKMKKRSNGFTLTELAIVIAVIAILIAVLVPTFISLINKAQESSDSQLVKNLNTSLSTEEAIDGSKATTMSEALAIAAENGYNVDKLTPSSSGDIVWDQESNRFLLISEDDEIVYSASETSSDVLDTKYQLWYIAQNASDVAKAKYSYYINYEATEVEATYGVDVGDNSGVAVTITGDSSVKASILVNTNGGTLTVNAESYDINHYGTARTVTIEKVATKSYHLYGEVSVKIEIAYGHIVCEAGSSVNSVIVTSEITGTSNNYNISVEVKSSAEVGGIGTTIEKNISTLSNIVTNNSSGTIEYAKSTTSNTDYAGGLGTEENPYLIATAQQLSNIGNLSVEMISTPYYFKLTDDIDMSDVESLSYSSTYVTQYFRGVLDGNDKTIKSSTKTSFKFAYDSLYDVTIKNLNVEQCNGKSFVLLAYANRYGANMGTVTLQNIVTSGDKISVGNNYSQFISHARGTVNFINITNGVDINMTGYAGIFLGGYFFNSSTTYGQTQVTYDTCVNNANISGVKVGFFTGNSSQCPAYLVYKEDFSDADAENNTYTYTSNSVKYTGYKAAVYITSCKNTGSMVGTDYCTAFAQVGNDQHKAANDSIGSYSGFTKGTMIVSSYTVSAGISNNNLVITTDYDSKYTTTVAYYASTSYYDENGISLGTAYIYIKVDATDNKAIYISKFNVVNLLDGTTKTDAYGNTYQLDAQTDGTYIANVVLTELYENTSTINYSTTIYYLVTVLNDSDSAMASVSGTISSLQTVETAA